MDAVRSGGPGGVSARIESRCNDGFGKVFVARESDFVCIAAHDDFESVGSQLLHVEHEFLVADVQSITSHYFPLGCQV